MTANRSPDAPVRLNPTPNQENAMQDSSDARSRERSCEDRIAAEMASREQSLAALLDRLDDADGDAYDEASEELDNYGLGVSAQVVVRVELSTGGPADWVEATCEVDRFGEANVYSSGMTPVYGEPISMTYHYSDWFDHAERPVSEDSPLWRYVAGILECGVEL